MIDFSDLFYFPDNFQKQYTYRIAYF